jgi:hypothetical protein
VAQASSRCVGAARSVNGGGKRLTAPLSGRRHAAPRRSSTRRAAASEATGEPPPPEEKDRAPAPESPAKKQMLVVVPPHPLINHWLGIARNATTPPPVFRSTLGELGRALVYECVRDWLPTFTTTVEGPLGGAAEAGAYTRSDSSST